MIELRVLDEDENKVIDEYFLISATLIFLLKTTNIMD